MKTENETSTLINDALKTEACIYKVTEISDLACAFQELKKYKGRVLKFMQ